MNRDLDPKLLEQLAEKVDTPFWVIDATTLRDRISKVKSIVDGPGMQARFAMKALPTTRVLEEMQAQGIWIDSVSGNEVLRALQAGFPQGNEPPQICFTADVFRDGALDVVMKNSILPNVGSPGMIDELAKAGYQGPVSIRVNPGFGHGHVNSCDTGGPSSKHGIWFEDLEPVRRAADEAGLKIAMIHAHIGSGPQYEELEENLSRLAEDFGKLLPDFPDVEAISLGGGIPHNYKDPDAEIPLEMLRQLFAKAHASLIEAAGRDLRLEIEPGRFYVAPAGTLVTRVTDIKTTNSNEKGDGAKFVMIDAGFVDLIRPAMYGSWHRIEIPGKMDQPTEPIAVAGPMCESGDVFTRDDQELLQPRDLPCPEIGDLLTIHDGGAYGYSMASNYNSFGRAPQIWLEEDGSCELISRRETVEDVIKCECREKLI